MKLSTVDLCGLHAFLLCPVCVNIYIYIDRYIYHLSCCFLAVEDTWFFESNFFLFK